MSNRYPEVRSASTLPKRKQHAFLQMGTIVDFLYDDYIASNPKDIE
jgi:hypothetical protein